MKCRLLILGSWHCRVGRIKGSRGSAWGEHPPLPHINLSSTNNTLFHWISLIKEDILFTMLYHRSLLFIVAFTCSTVLAAPLPIDNQISTKESNIISQTIAPLGTSTYIIASTTVVDETTLQQSLLPLIKRFVSISLKRHFHLADNCTGLVKSYKNITTGLQRHHPLQTMFLYQEESLSVVATLYVFFASSNYHNVPDLKFSVQWTRPRPDVMMVSDSGVGNKMTGKHSRNFIS